VPRISIIIPCLGGAAEFDGTLVSILQNRPADCEVIVAHTAEYDDPYSLKSEVHFLHAAADSLADLANAALEIATGDVIHIVGCGLEVREGWTAPAIQHFDDPEVAGVSPVVMSTSGEEVLAAGVRWTLGGGRRVIRDSRVLSRGSGRLRAKIEGPVLRAAFYRRDVLSALGGLEADLGDELADIGMALAIQSLGRLHVAEPASQVIQTDGAPTTKCCAASGRAAERLFCRHIASRGLVPSLLLHPLTVMSHLVASGSVVAGLTSLAGRCLAWLEFGAAGRYEQRIADAKERLAELAELRASVRKGGKGGRQKIDEAAAPLRRAA